MVGIKVYVEWTIVWLIISLVFIRVLDQTLHPRNLQFFSWLVKLKTIGPLNGKFRQLSIVYGSKVSSLEIIKNHPHYYGLNHPHTFKDRSYKHKNSFKYERKRNSTELSNYFSGQKKKKVDVPLQLYIKGKAEPYSPATKKCLLCLAEKYHILFSKNEYY